MSSCGGGLEEFAAMHADTGARRDRARSAEERIPTAGTTDGRNRTGNAGASPRDKAPHESVKLPAGRISVVSASRLHLALSCIWH